MFEMMARSGELSRSNGNCAPAMPRRSPPTAPPAGTRRAPPSTPRWKVFPATALSLAMLARTDHLAANPPPDWDGAWQMDHK